MKARWWILGVAAVAACGRSSSNGHGGDDTTIDGGGNGGSSATCGTGSLPWLPVGYLPTKLASGDFNRDGVVDVVAVNAGTSTVSVLLGIGGGRFAPASEYPAGDDGIAVADLDSDGKLDLAVTSYGGAVSILFGNDDGSFQSPSRIATVGERPTAVAAGDFDHDGHADLAIATLDGTLTVLLGRGAAHFAAPVTYSVDYDETNMTVSDVDHDGTLDLVASGPDYVDVVRGNGNGTFQGKLSYAVVAGGYGAGLGDVTGDGLPDVVVPVAEDDHVTVLPGTGAGTLGTPFNVPAGFDPRVVAVADVDGDGIADIIAGNASSATLLRGHGNGTFDAPREAAAGAASKAILATDLTGDGVADVAIASAASDVVTLWVPATGATPSVYPTARGPRIVTLADVDGDHHLDAIVLDSLADSVSILRGKGDGTFEAKRDAATGMYPLGLAVADFNGDGVLDVATANQSGGSVSVLLGTSDGSLSPRHDTTVVSIPGALVAADFTSDGHPDLVVDNPSYGLQVFVGHGDGTFTVGDLFSGGGAKGFVAADMDENGQTDFVGFNENAGSVVVFPSNGNGTFQPPHIYDTTTCVMSAAVGDLDGDGHLDVAVAGSCAGSSEGSSGTVGVLRGVGDGTLTREVDYAAGWQPTHVAIADVDGDGHLDLVIADGGSNAIGVMHNHGDGTFAPLEIHAAGSAPLSVESADLDGDGKVDFVTANSGADALGVLLGACMR